MKVFKMSGMCLFSIFLVVSTSCGHKKSDVENPRPQPAEVVVELIPPQAFKMSEIQMEKLNAVALKPEIDTCDKINNLAESLKIKEVKYTYRSMGSGDRQAEFNVKSPGPDCIVGENGLSISVVREAKGGERPTPQVNTSYLFMVGKDKAKLETLSVLTDCLSEMSNAALSHWKANKGDVTVPFANSISNTYNTEICPSMISSILDKLLDQIAAVKN